METNIHLHFCNLRVKIFICTRTTHVSNIHESKAWQQLYSGDGEFWGEVWSLSFALCLDGTNPFAKEYLYSMCPMLLVPLNLPQSLPISIMLAGIIPGPAEVKNTDPYLDVLVDEILDQHKPVYVALHDQVLTCRYPSH